MTPIQGVVMLLFFWMGQHDGPALPGRGDHRLQLRRQLRPVPRGHGRLLRRQDVGQNYGWVFLAYGVGGIVGPDHGRLLQGRRHRQGVQAWLPAFIISGVLCLVAAAVASRITRPEKPAAAGRRLTPSRPRPPTVIIAPPGASARRRGRRRSLPACTTPRSPRTGPAQQTRPPRDRHPGVTDRQRRPTSMSPAWCRAWASAPSCIALAERLGLTGWVSNTSAGVDIDLDGPPEALDASSPPCATKRRRWRASSRSRARSVPPRASRPSRSAQRRAIAGRLPAHLARRRHLPRLPAPSCSTRPTGATATPSPTAPTAARASPSSPTSPTTGPAPPWRAFPHVPGLRRASTTTRATAASTPSR